ncbi:MAG: TIGR03915 family putative DNA repair protein [Phycisphaerae bacterium]
MMVDFDGTFEGWRAAAGRYLRCEIKPHDLHWPDPYQRYGSLFAPLGSNGSGLRGNADRADPVSKLAHSAAAFRPLEKRYPPVPAARWTGFLNLAQRVCYARFSERFALLYRVAWRMRHGEPDLPLLLTDPDMLAIMRWDSSVRRDAHKTKAFVRFKLVHRDHRTGSEYFAAWHRPRHYPLRLVGSFFADRFASMRWAIFTPDENVCWDGSNMVYSKTRDGQTLQHEDDVEQLWCIYYSHIFNPARVNPAAMQREMPKHHWQTLPEGTIIPELIRHAQQATSRMQAHIDEPQRRRKFPVSDPGTSLPIKSSDQQSPDETEAVRLRNNPGRAEG